MKTEGTNSLILSAATQLLLPLMLMFSIFILLRGHNHPGGGFVGGLVGAAAFALYAFSEDVDRARALLRVDTLQLVGFGLLIAFLSAVISLLLGEPFMTAIWTSVDVPVIGILNTVLMFDFGVYLVVLGATLTIIFAMAESEED